MISKINSQYEGQVRMLLRLLPYFMRDTRFALKGGTAINLFHQDMPRLSVDIDLTYLPVEDREISLTNISESFEQIIQEIKVRFPNIRVQPVTTGEGNIKQVIFRGFDTVVKVEINHILRGVVHECQSRGLCQNAQDTFSSFVSALCLSQEDLYAGKICAALDRQHPRDLFDLKVMFEQRTFDDKLRKCFLAYLICNNRPISELINPNRQDLKVLFENEFLGMSLVPIKYEELLDTREQLIDHINKDLTNDERQFLISFKSGFPDWDLLGLEGIKDLPAIKWKLKNISKMESNKHLQSLEELKRKLGV